MLRATPPATSSGPGLATPALPADRGGPYGLPRGGSSSTTIELRGDEYAGGTPETVWPDGSALLEGDGGAAWLLYRFSGLLGSDSPDLLSIELDPSAGLPQRYWAAVSDYAANRWQWMSAGAPTADDSLPLLLGADSISPAGNMYILITVESGQALTLRSLTLRLEYGLPPPIDLRAGDGTSQQGVELAWTDPALTYGNDPQFAYENVVVARAKAPAGPWVERATVPAGTTSWLDAEARDEPAGQRFYYRLRTEHGGLRGHAGVADAGYVDRRPLAIYDATWNGSPAHAPFTVNFDASRSLDPDGGDLEYEWDWDGDGTVDFSSGADPTITHTYMDEAVELPKVWAVDDEGTRSNEGWGAEFNGANISGWMRICRDPDMGHLFASKLQVDAQGDIYAVSTNDDNAIQLDKLDGAGDLLQASAYAREIADPNADIVITDSSLTPDGCYLCGYASYSGYAWETDAFVARIALDGQLLWARTWGGDEWDIADGLAVGPDGSVTAIGSTQSVDGRYHSNLLILTYDADGNLATAQRWNDPALFGWGAAIARQPDGVLRVAGTVTGDGLNMQLLVLSIDADGQIARQHRWSMASGDFSRPKPASLLLAGPDLVVGGSLDSTNMSQGLLCRLDAGDNLAWLASGMEPIGQVGLGLDSCIYAAAQSGGYEQYGLDGTLMSAWQHGGSAPASIAIGPEGQLVLCGQSSPTPSGWNILAAYPRDAVATGLPVSGAIEDISGNQGDLGLATVPYSPQLASGPVYDGFYIVKYAP